ncbi:MAG: transporter [Candidatus Eremiobacteraeota bacterium]|nr:transporter [Candidatus Eremiobacteraeota bacterium]
MPSKKRADTTTMGLLNFISWLLGGDVRVKTTVWSRVWSSDDPTMADGMLDDPAAALGAGSGLATPPKPMWQQARDQIASLQKIDPGFSEVSFLTQASKTYLAALDAEDHMDAGALQGIASQSYTEQLANCITTWRAANLVRHVTGVTIDSPMIFKVTTDGACESIVVRFTGRSVRYTSNDSTGVVTDGGAQPAFFTEFATFTRPSGTTTPPTGANAPTHCPSCGAPIEPGTATCPYCNTPLSGTGTLWLIDRLAASPYT